MTNQSFYSVSTAVRAAQSLKGLDILNRLELDAIVAGIEHLPEGAFVASTKAHNTRKNQRILREGPLLVSMTHKGASVRIQHVKVLVAARPPKVEPGFQMKVPVPVKRVQVVKAELKSSELPTD